MRMAIISHIREFAADELPAIRWSGDGQDIVHPPNFRILQVVAARDVIRAHLRQERGLRKHELLAVSYRRRGKAEEG